jgi:hypothetical protein
MITTMLKTIAMTAIAAGVAVAAQAATVIPVSAIGSSSYSGYNDFYAIDQGPGSATTDWASNGEGNASKLNLDLGGVYTLSSAFVTDRVTSGGGNGGYTGGVTDFTTSFSLTVYTDATFTTTLGSSVVFNKPAPVSPTGVASFLDIEALGGLTGRYIQYSVLAAGVSNNPGLSDIHFEGTLANAVPEPATWGLMIVGFGMVGVSSRRRARTSVAV